MNRQGLTDFDREVLSILLSSGGWNASARSRLAILAKRYGVSSAGLSRVASGLAAAARSGRLQQHIASMRATAAIGGGAPARAARASAGGAAGTSEAPPTRALTKTDVILLGIVSGLLLVSAALATMLVLMIVPSLDRPDSAAANAPTSAPASASSDGARTSAAGAANAGDATGGGAPSGSSFADRAAANRAATAPGARGGPSSGPGAAAGAPTVPVSYPRVPGFRATLASLELDQALAQARGAAFALESIANEAPNDRGAIRAWSEAQRSVGRAWPRLDAVTRRALLDRSMSLLRRVDDSATAEALIEPFRADLAAAPRSPGEIWRGAWAAGMLGSLLSEPGLAPEVVAVIAGQRIAPAEGAGDAFDRFAASWLDRQLPAITELVLSGSPQEDFDRFEAWIEAQRQLRPAAEAQEAWLRAIDSLLHRPLRFDLPGTAADVLGRLASLVEWRGAQPGGASAARRWSRWLGDSSISAPRLWAFGSIVHQGRMAPWFDATMIVPERASMADREALVASMLAAMGPIGDETAPFSRVPKELAQRWDALASRERTSDDGARLVAPGISIASIRDGAAPSASDRALAGAESLRRLSELSTAGWLLVAGRSSEAAQRLSEIESAEGKPALAGLGPGGRSLAAPTEPSGDGLLGRRLDEARTPQEKIEVVRRRRAEAALDLGPLDAQRLVHEAYRGEPSGLRLTAQGVIVDSFASGRRVAQELVDQFSLSGGADAALARFVERLTGERLPPHPNPAFRAKAMAALLRHRLRLSEHAWHGVDALMGRMAETEATRLDAEGGAIESLRDSNDPGEVIDALGDLLRARAGARIVTKPFPASLETLDRRDEARRALADGAGQRLAASSWRALELEAYLAVAERPSMAAPLAEIMSKAQLDSTAAKGALDQALVTERARMEVLAVRIALESGGAP